MKKPDSCREPAASCRECRRRDCPLSDKYDYDLTREADIDRAQRNKVRLPE